MTDRLDALDELRMIAATLRGDAPRHVDLSMRMDRAIAALDSAPGGMDVERLREAMKRAEPFTSAEVVAQEYARLSQPPVPEGEG